jgi:hypothetical protein
MNLLRKRIKHLLDEVKSNQELNLKHSNNGYCVINLLFDTNEFTSKCSSIGDFMKKLRNGKISLENNVSFERPKQNNREYFNELIGDGGFYRSIYSYQFIEINIYIDLKRDIDNFIDRDIIKSRISKIVNPLKFKIGFNDRLLFDKTFKELTIEDTSWNVFGDVFRNKNVM